MSFKNEISILRAIHHPNIMKLDSVYESDNSYYIVLEYFSGGNLKELIKEQGVLTESNARFIMLQVLKAIKYLHENKILHRDIKPDNILFRSSDIYKDDQQVAIADFGLSTFDHLKEELYPCCGTPGFAAPEVVSYKKTKEKYDYRCDLYSFGVTLYYILTGRLPFTMKKPETKDKPIEHVLDLKRAEIYKDLSKNGSQSFIYRISFIFS